MEMEGGGGGVSLRNSAGQERKERVTTWILKVAGIGRSSDLCTSNKKKIQDIFKLYTLKIKFCCPVTCGAGVC